MASERLTRERANYWVGRWDRQQEYYMPDREERFAVIADVVEEMVGRPDPLVVDLGVGPGSLAARLLQRIPGTTVVGVDADPLLMGLADRAYGQPRFRTVYADLRDESWFDKLGLNRAPDAFVSTTSLHWMDRYPFGELLRRCGEVLAPGGIFVNGDHMYEGSSGPRIDGVTRSLTRRRARRVGTSRNEDWTAWWDAVVSAPELVELVRARNGGFDHTATERPTIDDHLGFLRAGGFSEAGIVWQVGDDRIVLGIR